MPDGNGEFTDGMGMLVDKADLGFGKRSWRYSMLVKDGVVAEDVHRAARRPGDPFEVSDADTMLAYINPKAKKPDQVAIFTREGCQFCAKAKALLTDLGYDYAEIPLRAHDSAAASSAPSTGAQHGAAGVRQRPAHRRARGARALGAQGGVNAHASGHGGGLAAAAAVAIEHLDATDQANHEAITVDVAVIGAGTAGLAAYRAADRRRQARRHHRGRAVRHDLRARRLHAEQAADRRRRSRARAARSGRSSACASTARSRVDGRAVMARVKRERDRFVGFVLEGVDAIPEADRIRGHARFVDDRTLEVDGHTRIALRPRRDRHRLVAGDSAAAARGWRPARSSTTTSSTGTTCRARWPCSVPA